MSAVASGPDLLVGMGESKVSKTQPLSALGLGSCIGLLAYCPLSGVAGMAHIMLPEAFPNQPIPLPGKFADTALPHLLAEMRKLGAGQMLRVAYAGGAQVFQFGSDAGGRMNVGERNAEAVAMHLSKARMRALAKDTGGSLGRTLRFDPATREATVRTVRGPAALLVKF